MYVEDRTFWLPKDGNMPQEREDAHWAHRSWDGGRFRFAVSDGASESILSGPWASTLARTLARDIGPFTKAGARKAVDLAGERHREWLGGYIAQREARGKPVQWYEEPGLAKGAFATFVALSFTGDDDRFRALALGDSCLFVVRGDKLLGSFPLRKSAEFLARPACASSNPVMNREAFGKMRATSGRRRSGDVFYLATDALSAWFLSEREQGRTPWRVLEEIGDSAGAFGDLVADLRGRKAMKNDDVTITRIKVE